MAPQPFRFLDTNVLLRYFTRDDEEKAQAARQLLLQVQAGVERVETSLPVVFETVYALQRFYRVPRLDIQRLLTGVIQMRGVRLAPKEVCLRGLALYAGRNISFADAFNAEYMRASRLQQIYSWDTDFDGMDGITRIEPRQTES